MSNQTASADDVFDALGDVTRRQIIARLRTGPTPVGELAAQLTVGRPAVSKHLRVLEGAGLVEHESRGTRNLYTLAPEGMAVAQQWLVGMWDTALASYADEVRAAAGVATGAPVDASVDAPIDAPVDATVEASADRPHDARPRSRTWAEKQAERQARRTTSGGQP